MVRARLVDPATLAVPVPIRTPRLILRPPRAGDGAALAEAVAESYDALHPWFHDAMGDADTEGDPSWQEGVVLQFADQFARRERLPFLVFAGDALAGLVELRPDWRVGRMRLAYWIRTSLAQRGIGAEAVCAATHYAFDALDARVVTTGHAEPNVASGRLAERLGFERIARQPYGVEMPDGRLVDGIALAVWSVDQLPDLAVRWGDAAA